MDVIFAKLKEVLSSVLPIAAIVLILNFTLAPLAMPLFWRFIIGTGLVIIGLTVFLFGVDIGITPIGNFMGASIAKTNRIFVVAFSGLFLGFFISIAEPDLHILAGQLDSVTAGLISKSSIVAVVSVGIATLISLGLIRIVFSIPLYKMLTFLYIIIFILALFTSPEFLAISFDASGATTGALTVPFILALAIGISALKKDSIASEEDSFGLVAIASTGAVISVMLMGIIAKAGGITGTPDLHKTVQSSVIAPFIKVIPKVSVEIFLAVAIIAILSPGFNFGGDCIYFYSSASSVISSVF